MATHDNLRDARAKIGKTQEWVATHAGMHVTQYNAYERGRSHPLPATLKRIARALETTSEALLGESIQVPRADERIWSAGIQTLDGLREAFRRDVGTLLGVAPAHLAVHIELC